MSWLDVYRFSLLLVNFIALTAAFDYKAFDDRILFKINWPDKTGANLLESPNTDPYTITTADNEKYQCFIPESMEEKVTEDEEYTGPNPIEYLFNLFSQNTCSYRLESYWTYELCHGRHVQQYHEERDGKRLKVQKYELGKFDVAQVKKLSDNYDEQAKNKNRKSEIPVKKIDGVNMPYVEIEMTDGTLCDLNDKPRSIKVLYVCFQHGKQEIYSIKETATCEYEAVVLTPNLCDHPDYKPQDTGEKKINCQPLDGAKKRPKSLMQMELESLKLRFQKVTDEKPQKVYAIFRVDKDGQDGPPQVRVEIHPVDSNGKHYSLDNSLNPVVDQGNLGKSNSVESFLSGRNCLNGGNGWWKYEFCYGLSVTQYHIEIGGSKTVINLGVFNKEKHMEWIEANPHKKPKPVGQRKQISHFYSHGTACDKTGKLRQTEVKLKCIQKPASGSSSSVSLYLLEPKTCEYVLGVESQMICNILDHADDTYGIISEKVLMNFDELKTNLHVEDDDERIANGDE